MPYVKSYFRSSPGAAGGGAAAARRLDVALYDADGENLLRGAGAEWALSDLQFESGLPGGFLSASFRIDGPVARHWPGRAGLKTVIRRGNQGVWWGWIEDVRQAVRGRVEGLQVTCLGAYQQLRQRLCSPNYATTIYSNEVLGEVLAAHCPDIGEDYSDLAATGVDLNPLTWSYKPVADLVKLVCDAGNTAGQRMLFAIWEPAWATYVPRSNVVNPQFSTWLTGWTTTAAAGTTWTVWNGTYKSPPTCMAARRFSAGGTLTIYQSVAVTESLTYTVEFAALLAPAGAAVSVWFTVAWKDIGGAAISTSTGTTRTSATTDWKRYAETVTSPAGAATGVLTVHVTVPNTSGAACYLDDVYMYSEQQHLIKPKAFLWARDLSVADYRLYTADLDTALNVDVTTREMANAVLASYGAGSYTALAANAASQAAYRRRDALVAAGEVSATVAAAMRDAYLARHKEPLAEPGSFKLGRPGPVRTARGAAVWPEDLRAGDRLEVADGPLAGRIVLLDRVTYADGTVTCTPERLDDVPLLLAKGLR